MDTLKQSVLKFGKTDKKKEEAATATANAAAASSSSESTSPSSSSSSKKNADDENPMSVECLDESSSSSSAHEDEMDTSADKLSSKLDDTAPDTPKGTSANLDKSKNGKSCEIDKNLKLQMRLESEKKRKEEKDKKEREKKEREAQRQKEKERLAEEKAEKERKRIEQINLRNEEKKKREEEKEREKKQKEEERLKREEEKRLKEEEKERERKQKEEEKERERKLRDEEKLKKEEERRQKEEERLREEEEKKRKEEKIKSHFVSYFIKKDQNSEKDEAAKSGRSMPSKTKENMIVAPTCRRGDLLRMSQEERDEYMDNVRDAIFKNDSNFKSNYLTEIRKNPSLIRKQTDSCRKKQLPMSDSKLNNENSIDIVELESIQTKFKVKFLMFDPKNYRRPPYYGTWRKRSKVIRAKNPFAKDDKFLNYEVNSDDEWEDEPEDAESVDNSGDEEGEEAGDEDDDDGFFVPHGHLSDEELDEDDRMVDPETRKAREKVRNDIYEMERKKSSKMILPKSYMVPKYWDKTFKPDSIRIKEDEIRFLQKYKMVLLASLPITIQIDKKKEETSTKSSKSTNPGETTPSSSKAKSKAKHAQLAQVNSSPAPTTVTAAALSTPASPIVPSAPATNCQPILKFISKKTKNNVICIENVTSTSSPSPLLIPVTTTTTLTPVITTPVTETSAEPVILAVKTVLKSPSKTNTGTPKTPPVNKTSVASNPANTKLNATPTNTITPDSKNLNTSEKRTLSSGNREGTVKRLKLDESHRVMSPTSPKTNIMNMFKKTTGGSMAAKKTVESNEKMEVESTSEKVGVKKTAAPMVVNGGDDSSMGKENKTTAEIIILDV